MFILDTRLQDDTFLLGNLPICQIRLMNNSNFPWIILIPKLKNKIELIDLTDTELNEIMLEVTQASNILYGLYSPDKLNIATLGNIVKQLHFHVIARFEKDICWPNPVWGSSKIPYTNEHKISTVTQLVTSFKKLSRFEEPFTQ